MTNSDLIERITRSLAYMLRHQPEEFDLELDAHGYGELEEVVRALSERLGEDIEVEDVEEAISSGDRPRYEIEGDRVRALYGHSIDVDPGEPAQPPDMLYVGINSRDARRAVQYGLRGGRRRFLHLARTLEDARETGRRTGVEYSVLTVHALDAWEDGVNFYDRQALFLAEQIPTEFLELAESRDDGIEREPRGRDRSRGGRRGGRDSAPRGGRGRGRGRDGARERGGRPERSEHDRPRGDRDAARGDREHGRGDRDRSDRDRSDRDRGDRDRGDRAERPRRERDDTAARSPERGDRERSAPESKPAPEPARKPAREEPSSGGFGRGIFEPAAPKPRTERQHAERPRTEPAPEPAPEPVEPKRAPKPEPKPEPEPVDDFGSGL